MIPALVGILMKFCAMKLVNFIETVSWANVAGILVAELTALASQVHAAYLA
jgi:hypothetical protein